MSPPPQGGVGPAFVGRSLTKNSELDTTCTRIVWAPFFSDMRRLPEFKTLITELKLVDFWRTSGRWGDFCKPVGADDFECH
jgi:hypothetical protein